ncbi:MAG TPA: hypothetical protein VIG50_12995 [Vicinamibacteria bacterium]
MSRNRLASWWGLCALSGALVACSGSNPLARARPGDDASARGPAGAADARTLDAGGVENVTICHVPPGNPSNAHTITVGAPAVPAHLDHGDTLGECGTGGG